jgi:hypothetical protein
MLDVDAADGISMSDKIFDQVMSDEPACTGHQRHFPVSHFASPLAARNPVRI